MKIPLLALIIQGIPESTAVVCLAYLIAGITVRWRRAILLGGILAFSAYLIRLLPFGFGIHTLALLGILFLALTYIEKCGVLTALKAALLSELALILIESLCLRLIMSFTGLSFEDIFSDTYLRIIFTLPQVGLLFLLAFILWRINSRTVVKGGNHESR